MEYMIPSAYDFFWVQENGYFSDLRNNILCRETESIFHTHTYVPLGGGGGVPPTLLRGLCEIKKKVLFFVPSFAPLEKFATQVGVFFLFRTAFKRGWGSPPPPKRYVCVCVKY